MKKAFAVFALAALIAGAAAAQSGAWGYAAPVTVKGTLTLQNGVIALTGENAVYFVPALTRYIGFIDGLKEGAKVSVAGSVNGNVIAPSQITVNGKSYDLLGVNAGYGCGGGYCYGGGVTGGRRGRW
jgi:hypothetical protein